MTLATARKFFVVLIYNRAKNFRSSKVWKRWNQNVSYPRPSRGCVLSSGLYGDHVKASREKWKKEEAFVPGLKSVLSSEDLSFSSTFSMDCSERCCSARERRSTQWPPQAQLFQAWFSPAAGIARVTGSEDCNFINGLKQESTAGEAARRGGQTRSRWVDGMLSLGFLRAHTEWLPCALPSCYASACHRPESKGTSWPWLLRP